MPSFMWGAIATGVAVAALAMAATPARATTDRADYDAQVNSICKVSNAQQEQFIDSLEQTLARLDRRAHKLRGKKRQKIRQREERLFEQAPSQSLAIVSAELAQLKAVLPAPGDEALVSEWLAKRDLEVQLYVQTIQIDAQIDKVYDIDLFAHNYKQLRKKIRRQDRQLKRLRRQENSLYEQLEATYKADLELGTQLGANYCVTGATGTVIVSGT
jgi:ribosome-associated translation inhibitor RaiA